MIAKSGWRVNSQRSVDRRKVGRSDNGRRLVIDRRGRRGRNRGGIGCWRARGLGRRRRRVGRFGGDRCRCLRGRFSRGCGRRRRARRGWPRRCGCGCSGHRRRGQRQGQGFSTGSSRGRRRARGRRAGGIYGHGNGWPRRSGPRGIRGDRSRLRFVRRGRRRAGCRLVSLACLAHGAGLCFGGGQRPAAKLDDHRLHWAIATTHSTHPDL